MMGRSWILAALMAVSLHALALYALVADGSAMDGDSQDAGESGIEIGLGTLGSFANIQERMSMLNDVSVEQTEVEASQPIQEKIVTESQKTEILKPLQETAIANEHSVKPVKDAENKTINEASTSESESDNESEAVIPKTTPSAAYVQASIKSTGRADELKSGGVKGNAKNYINQMNRWLAQHQRYPMAAKKDKQEGTVRVAFTIDRQGKVLRRSIEKSSGYPLLDDAALKVLDDASPLPEVPDDFAPGRAQLSLVKPIDFTLITNTSFKD